MKRPFNRGTGDPIRCEICHAPGQRHPDLVNPYCDRHTALIRKFKASGKRQPPRVTTFMETHRRGGIRQKALPMNDTPGYRKEV